MVGGFEQRDPGVAGQGARRGQAGDAGADDGDPPHRRPAAALRRRRGRPGRRGPGLRRRMSPSAPGGTREGGGRRRTPRGFQPDTTGRLRDENRFDAPLRGIADASMTRLAAAGVPLPGEICRSLFSASAAGASGMYASRAAPDARQCRDRRRWRRPRPRFGPGPGSATKLRRLARHAHALSGTLQAARSRSLEHGHRHPVGPVRRRPALRRAGADDQDERHHRMGGAAGDRDVPARQPRRQRLLAPS